MEQSETSKNAAGESGKARETAPAKSAAAAVNAVNPDRLRPLLCQRNLWQAPCLRKWVPSLVPLAAEPARKARQ